LAELRHGQRVAVAGLVLVRQRPGSAKGVIFITLEDETGIANLVIMPDLFETFRREILGARLLGARGRVERQDSVIHLKIDRLYDLSERLADLSAEVGEAALAGALARADEVRRPPRDHRVPADPTGGQGLELARRSAPKARSVDSAVKAIPKARSFR
jgi:error-prone DNA polymerase